MAKQESKTNVSEMTLHEKLSLIQIEFKANKSMYNSFGKYYFRSAEDILEGLKPFNQKYGVYFTIKEDMISVPNSGPTIISEATIHDTNGEDSISSTAIVGVDLLQKGMQTPQAFGSASSYGKKYALGNLLLIDDTQDADATNTHGKSDAPAAKRPKLDVNDEAFEKAKQFIANGGSVDTIKTKYELSKEAEIALTKK
jgi:hypothetical protein